MSKKTNEETATPMSKKKSREDVLSLIDSDEEKSRFDLVDTFTKEVDIQPVRSKEDTIKDSDLYDSDVDLDKIVSAPEEWNFFKALNEQKAMELTDSIMRLGLLNRIILWEQPDKKFMMLSGHNRLAVFNNLYSASSDEKYAKIPARIYKHSAIDEWDAKEIIIDSNLAQRDLTPSEKVRAIVEKVKIYTAKVHKDKNIGRVRDLVAEKHDLKGRMVGYYIKLGDLIPEFLALVDQQLLSVKNAAVIAGLTREHQGMLYHKYKDSIDKTTFVGIQSAKSPDEIETIISKNIEGKKLKSEVKLSRILLEVPYGKDKEIADLLEKWRDDNGFSENEFRIQFR